MKFYINKFIALAIIIFSPIILRILYIPLYNLLFEYFIDFNIYQIISMISIWIVGILIFFFPKSQT